MTPQARQCGLLRKLATLIITEANPEPSICHSYPWRSSSTDFHDEGVLLNQQFHCLIEIARR